MKNYCVTYKVGCGFYVYRCWAMNKTEARKLCRQYMGCKNSDIVEVKEV